MEGYVAVADLKARLLRTMEVSLRKSKSFASWSKSLSEKHYNRAMVVYTITNEILGIDLLEDADEDLLELLD